MSAGSKRLDRVKKPPRYRDFGVPEYWVVDPEGRRIEVYRLSAHPSPEICDDTIRWQPVPNAPALELRVPDVFSRVDGAAADRGNA